VESEMVLFLVKNIFIKSVKSKHVLMVKMVEMTKITVYVVAAFLSVILLNPTLLVLLCLEAIT
jgi:hypothetical protein